MSSSESQIRMEDILRKAIRPYEPSVEPEAGVLTRGAIESAIDSLRNATYTACGHTIPHVVHPHAVGWANCANCCALLWVFDDAEGRKRVSYNPPLSEIRKLTEGADDVDP